MRTPSQDRIFLQECRDRLSEVLWNKKIRSELSAKELAPLIAWAKKQEDPLTGESKAPIPPGKMGPFVNEDTDINTMHLLNGAKYVDGGGRGCRAMKARADGDCFLVSVASLAFGGRCTSVGQAEGYALPLRAAMVRHAVVKMNPFVKVKGCFRKPTFYDAEVAEGVFACWDAETSSLSAEQARVALLYMVWSVSKVGTPCPLACAPILADVLGLGLRIFHPGMTLGCGEVPRRVYTPLRRGAGGNQPPLLVSFTLCNPSWAKKHPFKSLWQYKEQCFGHRGDGRGVYSFQAFTHIVPILPPLDIVQQMVKETDYIMRLKNGAELSGDAHIISDDDRELIDLQENRAKEAAGKRKEPKESKRGAQQARLADESKRAEGERTRAVPEAKKTAKVLSRKERLALEKAAKKKEEERQLRKAIAEHTSKAGTLTAKQRREARKKAGRAEENEPEASRAASSGTAAAMPPATTTGCVAELKGKDPPEASPAVAAIPPAAMPFPATSGMGTASTSMEENEPEASRAASSATAAAMPPTINTGYGAEMKGKNPPEASRAMPAIPPAAIPLPATSWSATISTFSDKTPPKASQAVVAISLAAIPCPASSGSATISTSMEGNEPEVSRAASSATAAAMPPTTTTGCVAELKDLNPPEASPAVASIPPAAMPCPATYGMGTASTSMDGNEPEASRAASSATAAAMPPTTTTGCGAELEDMDPPEASRTVVAVPPVIMPCPATNGLGASSIEHDVPETQREPGIPERESRVSAAVREITAPAVGRQAFNLVCRGFLTVAALAGILLASNRIVSSAPCGVHALSRYHPALLPGECMEAEGGFRGLLGFLPGLKKSRLSVEEHGGTYHGPDGRKVAIERIVPEASHGPGLLCGAERFVRYVTGKGGMDYGMRQAHGRLIFGEGYYCPTHATPGPRNMAELLRSGEARFSREGHLEVVSGNGDVLWSVAPDALTGSTGQSEGRGGGWRWPGGRHRRRRKEDRL